MLGLNKYLPRRKKEFLYQESLGIVYVNPLEALRIDRDGRTIWLNTDIKNYSFQQSAFHSFPVERKSIGRSDDFTLISIPKQEIIHAISAFKNFSVRKFISLDNSGLFVSLFMVGEQGESEYIKKTLLDKIQTLIQLFNQLTKSIEESGKRINVNFPAFLRDIENLNEEDFNNLEIFYNFLRENTISKVNMEDMLSNSNWVLVAGDLIGDELLKYQPRIQNSEFVEQDESKMLELFEKYFGSIFIDEDRKNAFISSMGLYSICAGRKPEKGGVILVDSGGTGKSLLKKALENFVFELETLNKSNGACVKDRGESDVTSYANSGPQLIQRWFKGSKTKDHISSRTEEDLVAEAIKRGVPSFLIVDEAKIN